jgi:hypothetical protein
MSKQARLGRRQRGWGVVITCSLGRGVAEDGPLPACQRDRIDVDSRHVVRPPVARTPGGPVRAGYVPNPVSDGSRVDAGVRQYVSQ